MKRFAFIDSLRGLAIALVIWHHSNQGITGLPSFLKTLSDQGARGVQLFFFLSAFTLFLSVHNRQEEQNPTLNFFIRRFFRIAPLFYFGLVLYLAIDGLQVRPGEVYGVTLPSIIATLFFMHGLNPYWINNVVPGGWSVGVEMVFYCLIPYLFVKIKGLNQAIWLTFITLLLSIIQSMGLSKVSAIADADIWRRFLFYWLPNQMPIFCLGIVFYFIFLKLQASNFLSLEFSKERQQLALVLLLLSCFFFVALAYEGYVFIPKIFPYGLVFLTLTLALFLHPFEFIVNRFTCHLGKISYSAYIVHFALIAPSLALTKLVAGSLSPIFQLGLLFIILLLGTCLVATLTYQFIELPGQNLGKIAIKKLSKEQPTSG
ncbi:hypothetical protein TUMEXPCC7403_16820 [Tumidithrix helvetica PCC 7403]|uniref:acyltransferase family protein n=1 Tax=Tumidithrix helvetica TaxID=3457545 RepID=UPI003C8EF5F5